MNRFARVIAAIVLSATAVAWMAVPAMAKEGIEATLASPLPLDAREGEQIRLTWTVGFLDDSQDGQWQPISGEGIFIRLLSLADGEPSTLTGTEFEPGHYAADVTVPEGGIGGLEIGVPSGETDFLFPITNSPFPSTVEGEPAGHPNESGSFPVWLIVVLAVAFAGGVGTLGATILRRRGSASSSEGGAPKPADSASGL